MAKHSLMRDFVHFIKTEKAYWMVPLVILLLVLSVLAVVTNNPAVAPFLYPLF